MLGRREFAGMAGVGLLMWPARGRAEATGLITGGVTVTHGLKKRQKRDHSGVVVYLKSVRGVLPTGESREIRQIDHRFVPAVSVVTKGTTLTFPNDDKIYHNVFSNSSPAKFDLGLYAKGATRSIRLQKPGQVEVYCNIHESMRATVLVVDTVYYDQTDRSGAFAIADVPVGTHEYVVWQRDAKLLLHGRVKVIAGAPVHLDLTIHEGTAARRRKKSGHAYSPY